MPYTFAYMSRSYLRINNELIALIMRRYRLRTKTEAVDLALRRLAGYPMTTNEALAMRGMGAIGEVPQDESPA